MIAQANRQAVKFLQTLPLCILGAAAASAAPTEFYPQPQPSNAEQFILEKINIARANPAAEGQMLAGITDSEILRYYSHYEVDANKLRSDFAKYAVRPPLAFNTKLMASARQHSQDQARNGFQGHDGTDGSHFDQRIINQGYDWRALGENVFAYVENPFFGHVGLNADWGVPSLDHRANIMNNDNNFPVYKEVGIACVASSVKDFGPLVITQDFGAPANPDASFLLGVVYDDKNGNGAYDEGEGLGGVSVMPDSGTYYTTTSASGGYVLPLPVGAGTMTVVVSGGAFGAPSTKVITFANADNVKLDFIAAAPAVVPSVEISTAAADAAAVDGKVGVIVIKRTGNKAADLNVSLAVGGSAISGVDYAALPASVTIPAGEKSVKVTVSPLNATFAGVKKVKVKATPGADYTVRSGGQGTVRIRGAF